MSRTIDGKFIQVREFNIFFSHVTELILHYYDTEEHAGSVFVLGDYIWQGAKYFRDRHPGKKIIVYQLEQLCGGPNWHSVARTIENLSGMDEVWEYDALNMTYLSWHNSGASRLAPMRYVPALRKIQNREPDIDMLFYGYMNERRNRRFLEQLQTKFYGRLRFLHAYGIFGAELDGLIARSKIILNLHAFEPYHRQEQVRIFYPLVNGKCVLSEKSQLNYFGNAILEFTEEDFPAKIEEAMVRWREVGEEGAAKFERETSDREAYEKTVADYRERAARA